MAKEGKEIEYIDVLASSRNMNAMLKHSAGVRKVPVIVAGGDVTIGFDGQT